MKPKRKEVDKFFISGLEPEIQKRKKILNLLRLPFRQMKKAYLKIQERRSKKVYQEIGEETY